MRSASEWLHQLQLQLQHPGAQICRPEDDIRALQATQLGLRAAKPSLTRSFSSFTAAKTQAADQTQGNKQGLICGVSATAENGSGGRISCGLPMYRDKETGAPYIVPLYSEPESRPGRGSAPTQAEAAASAASTKLRRDALELLRRFLDSTPAGAGTEVSDAAEGTSSPGPLVPTVPSGLPSGMGQGLYYPVPNRNVPNGVEVVPDLGHLSGGPPNTAGPGAFL
eukprot:TRINITY_DN28208_c0_g1_i1.p1 TRINITY_DN28208_c0_g1~~TRINITY_DN28208_c0_g1_i1.p1  ORF type:complete len:224 (-),score=33.15 TRINITY_DN28208_c0_g1_i1:104-775(-)